MTHRQDMSGSNAADAVSVLLVSSIFMESLVLALSADMPAVIMRVVCEELVAWFYGRVTAL